MIRSIFKISVIFILAMNVGVNGSESPKLTGPYFGQQPPEMTPEIFAPGIVSTKDRVYANVTFSPGLTEASWTPNSADQTVWHGGIIISKIVEGVWTRPKEIRFLDESFNHRSPYFGLNGKKLYFQAYRSDMKGWDQKEKFYYVEKISGKWSNPKLLDPLFNKYAVHWQFSLDKRENLYFGGDLRGVKNTGGIYCSKYLNGKYQEPELIFSNDKYGEAVFGPAISPDGKYILITRIHPRGSDNPRIFSIYISFMIEDKGWTEPVELSKIFNMEGNQPRISPDGKYIFFVRNDGQSYWVSAKTIKELKPPGKSGK